jgi:hypothetical protein
MEEKRNAYRVLLGKTEGKRPLRKPRRKREYNNKMDFRDRMAWYGLDSSGSEQRPLAGSCGESKEHSGSLKYSEILE